MDVTASKRGQDPLTDRRFAALLSLASRLRPVTSFAPRCSPPHPGSLAANHAAKMEMITRLSSPSQPLATHQAEANAQHYEVPTAFLQLCLGPRMKYSSCVYPSLILPDGRARAASSAKETLGEAEVAMLETYTVKAGLGSRKDQLEKEGKDGSKAGEGLKLLDLGCGWGSLGLYLAEVCAELGWECFAGRRC